MYAPNWGFVRVKPAERPREARQAPPLQTPLRGLAA